jgi:hypothetical protein
VAPGGDLSAARILDSSVPQHVAPAHSCDLVIELPATQPDASSTGSAFLVEVQLRRRRRKEWIWPLCWAAMHRQLRGGRVWLVVITTSLSVARWASRVLARVIPAAGGWVVIGPGTMSRITDRDEARRQPELALLSAFIHGGRDDLDLAPAVACSDPARLEVWLRRALTAATVDEILAP